MQVVLYTKSNCAYCNSAKMMLTSKNIPYTEQKLGEDFTRETLLELFPTASTFPVILVDGFNIGGFQELRKMLSESHDSPTQKLLNEGI